MIQSGVQSDDNITFHPAVIPLAKFCLGQLEQGKLSCNHTSDMSVIMTTADTSTLHTLNFLKDTLAHMATQVRAFRGTKVSVVKVAKHTVICEEIMNLESVKFSPSKNSVVYIVHGIHSGNHSR